jgi:hypothetical protein
MRRRLHNEIVTFTRMLEPTAREAELRQLSFAAVRDVVHSIWKEARVDVFGSFATGARGGRCCRCVCRTGGRWGANTWRGLGVGVGWGGSVGVSTHCHV